MVVVVVRNKELNIINIQTECKIKLFCAIGAFKHFHNPGSYVNTAKKYYLFSRKAASCQFSGKQIYVLLFTFYRRKLIVHQAPKGPAA